MAIKKLTDKVQAKCKDMGLSEKHLNDLAEALGTGITEDSTDEEVDKVVNLIVSVAKSTQSEATRWAQKKEQKPEEKKPEEKPEEKKTPEEEPPYFKAFRESLEKRINTLEEKEKQSAKEKAAAKRTADIEAALDKYKIPQAIRKYVGNVPADVEDVDKFIAEAAQTVVTSQLPLAGGGEHKVATEKAVEETGKGWFQRLTGKTATTTETSNK